MKIQIISRVDSSVLFEHDAENNTVRTTIKHAVKSQADLSGAYLSGADLSGEILDKAPILLTNLEWSVLITSKYMRIGCKRYTHEEWMAFNDGEISAMEKRALEFWRKWKSPLMALCDTHSEQQR